MYALIHYVDNINFRRSLFGAAPLDLYADYAEVSHQIEVLGSPEILSGDGHYTIEETTQNTNVWLDAMSQLKEIEKELA